MFCREAALTVILVKGGLELNASQLRRLSGVVARLTVLPCVAEAVAAGVAAYFILPNFSLVWGLTLGWVLILLEYYNGNNISRFLPGLISGLLDTPNFLYYSIRYEL